MTMDCEQLVEILPWYVNGTLDDAQRETARAHLASCPRCRTEWEETRFALAAAQTHIHADALLDYVSRREMLPAHERTLLERHLVACTACAEEEALVRESFALQSEPARVIAFPPRLVPRWQSLRWWQFGAMAASLLGLVALVGWWWSWQQSRAKQIRLAQLTQTQRATGELVAALETENQRLRQTPAPTATPDNANRIAQLEARVRELSAPQLNVPVLEVFPAEMTQRDTSAPATQLTIPANARRVTLILNSQSTITARSYQLEIRDTRNRVVTTAQGLVRQATGDYTVSLAAESLPSGSYTFNVYTQVAGQRTKIESYRVRVR